MSHIMLHYSSIIAFTFAGFCGIGLIPMLFAAFKIWRRHNDDIRNVVWEAPVFVFALGLFWLSLALELASYA